MKLSLLKYIGMVKEGGIVMGYGHFCGGPAYPNYGYCGCWPGYGYPARGSGFGFALIVVLLILLLVLGGGYYYYNYFGK